MSIYLILFAFMNDNMPNFQVFRLFKALRSEGNFYIGFFIRDNMQNEMRHWKRVFGDLRYVIFALIIAILFYTLNVFIANFRTLIDFYPSLGFFGSLNFLFSLMIGFKNVIKASSFASLIIISLMLGMLFSLMTYKINSSHSYEKNKGTGFISAVGVFLGAFAPGCAACGIGLASVLGLGGAFLAAFPLGGLEFSILAIVIIGIAIFKTSNSSCKVMLNKKVKGGKIK